MSNSPSNRFSALEDDGSASSGEEDFNKDKLELEALDQDQYKLTKAQRKKKRKKERQSMSSVSDADSPGKAVDGRITKILENMATKADVQNITKIVNDAVADAVKREVASLRKEITDLRNSHSIEINELKNSHSTEINTLKNAHALELESIKSHLNQQENMLKKAFQATNANAQYSRRNNIRIFGLKKGPHPHEDCPESVCDFLNKNLDMNLEKKDIGAAHRLPRKVNGASSEPDPVIVRFNDRATRDNVIRNRRNLRDKSVKIKDDLTQANSGLLNRAFNHPQIEYAYFFNGKVFAVSKDYYRFQIDILDDINSKLLERNKGYKITPKERQKPRAFTPRSDFTDLKWVYGPK